MVAVVAVEIRTSQQTSINKQCTSKPTSVQTHGFPGIPLESVVAIHAQEYRHTRISGIIIIIIIIIIIMCWLVSHAFQCLYSSLTCSTLSVGKSERENHLRRCHHHKATKLQLPISRSLFVFRSFFKLCFLPLLSFSFLSFFLSFFTFPFLRIGHLHTPSPIGLVEWETGIKHHQHHHHHNHHQQHHFLPCYSIYYLASEITISQADISSDTSFCCAF